jgi:hypothetical protein
VDLGPLRTLATSIAFDCSPGGVDATVTRPFPDTTPITTRGVWVAPMDESQPYGTDYRKREPRRVLALPRADVPTLPRGTVIVAPEAPGGANVNWRVDGLDSSVVPGHLRAIVIQIQA